MVAAAPGPYTDQLDSGSPATARAGPQSASSYRRDTDPADTAPGASDDPAALDMLSTAGLDHRARIRAHGTATAEHAGPRQRDERAQDGDWTADAHVDQDAAPASDRLLIGPWYVVGVSGGADGDRGGGLRFSRRSLLRAGVLGAAALSGSAIRRPAAARAAEAGSANSALGVYEFNQDWLFGGVYTGGAEAPGHPESGFSAVTLPHTVTPLSWGDWDVRRH